MKGPKTEEERSDTKGPRTQENETNFRCPEVRLGPLSHLFRRDLWTPKIWTADVPRTKKIFKNTAGFLRFPNANSDLVVSS